MEKKQLQDFVEEFINSAVKESECGSWIWSDGAVEYYFQSTLTEADMQLLDDLLSSDERILYCEIYTDESGRVVVDCNLCLDALELACRHAIVLKNAKNGEEYYLQHYDLAGDEQDFDTDEDLLKQAEILIENNFDFSSIDEEFEIEKRSTAFGIRDIIDTIYY